MKTEESAISLDDSHRKEAETESLSTTIKSAPFRITSRVVSSVWAMVHPLGPRLVPLVVYVALMPLVYLLSLSTGWIVWNYIASGWDLPLLLQYGDNRPPYAHTVIKSLHPSQPYDIILSLAVPQTEANLALGNFMASLLLTSPSNKTLAETRVPSIVLPPCSFWPFRGRTSSVKIPLLSSFTFGTSEALAFLEVGRRDGWTSLGNGHGKELSVAAASLQGRVVHQGIRGLITRAPLTFSVFAAAAFFIVTMLILGACILPLTFSTRAPETKPQEESQQPPTSGDESSERETGSSDQERRRARKRGRRGSHSPRTQPIGGEAPSAIIPPADVPRQPLRRRHTSSLSDSDD